MIFKEDYRHAHAAYLKGQEISRDKEIIDNHVFPAAFKAAMASSHMELFYRDFYNDGSQWGAKISKGRAWSEKKYGCITT